MTRVVNDLQSDRSVLEALAGNLPGTATAVYDRQLVLMFHATSRKEARFMGWDKAVGQPLTTVFTHYSQEALDFLCSQYRSAFVGKRVEFDLVLGEECEHHSVTPITGGTGEVEQILCLVQNVTEQRRSLDALRESEAHLKVATQLARIGYWELDVNTFMFTFNDQFFEILKVTPEKLGGYHISAQRYAEQFLYEEERHMIQTETLQAINSDDPNFSRYVEHRFIDGTGRPGYLGVRYFVVKDESGRTIKTVGANQDITERKLAEQELKKLLDKTTDQNRRLKDFSFMTSHNIRSSVANLIGLSSMLKEEPGNPVYVDMLATTVQELDKNVNNINTLLNFEDSLNSELRRNCNIHTAVQRFIELNANWIKSKGANIKSLLPEDLSVYCVPAYIDSIVHNLLTNAVKYGTTETSKDNEVGRASTESPAIYIRDFGAGIDLKKHGNKMFKLGKRFHAGRDGQGIGLYMTKHQIESAGGRITVDSSPGKGTTFTVFFGSDK